MNSDTAVLELGIKPKKHDDSPKMVSEDSTEERYPEVEFCGEHADLFRKKFGSCAPGDVFMVGGPDGGVELKVKSSSDGENEYEKRIKFCMTKIFGDVVEEDAKEEKDEPAGDSKPARRVSKKEKPENKALAASY